jgi:DNA-binding LacI/PurR family transcriptional regulator
MPSLRERTKTETLVATLRRDLLAGKWTDKSLPSERALCEQLGVSRVTVRSALATLRREGAVVSRRGLGNFPAPRGIEPGTDSRQCIVYYYADGTGASVMDDTHVGIVNGASAESIRRGLSLLTICRMPVDFLQALGNGLREDLRGVILDWATLSLADELRSRGIPFLVVEDRIQAPGTVSIVQDNHGGIMCALEHFWKHGHRRLGLILNERADLHTLERRAAYRQFHLNHDLPCVAERLVTVAAADGRKALAALLDLDEPPTAALVGSRGLLPGVMTELAARGLRCPDDLSIVGWANYAPYGLQEPTFPVSTVSWRTDAMGRLAVRALEDIVRNGASEQMEFRVKTELVERGSVCACTR